jgi:hypothetical protein
LSVALQSLILTDTSRLSRIVIKVNYPIKYLLIVTQCCCKNASRLRQKLGLQGSGFLSYLIMWLMDRWQWSNSCFARAVKMSMFFCDLILMDASEMNDNVGFIFISAY